MNAHARATAISRVQVIAPEGLAPTAIEALKARGIDARAATAPSVDDVVAWALDQPPTAAAALELAAACAHAATAGRPIVLFVPPQMGTGRAAIERAAALAYLRAHGAALVHDVDAWLEAVAMLVQFGMPAGPQAAVIAPPGRGSKHRRWGSPPKQKRPACGPRRWVRVIRPMWCSTTSRSARRQRRRLACTCR